MQSWLEEARFSSKHYGKRPGKFLKTRIGSTLSATMKNKRRVHIYKSFVLVYKIHEKEKIVELWGYEHHDKMHR